MAKGAGRFLASPKRGGAKAGLASQNSRSPRGVSGRRGRGLRAGAGLSLAPPREVGGAEAGPEAPPRTVAALGERLGRRRCAEEPLAS